MTAFSRFTIVCGQCGGGWVTGFGLAFDRPAALASADNAGWHLPSGGDSALCPRCSGSNPHFRLDMVLPAGTPLQDLHESHWLQCDQCGCELLADIHGQSRQDADLYFMTLAWKYLDHRRHICPRCTGAWPEFKPTFEAGPALKPH